MARQLRVFLDTNVLVSGFATGGLSAYVVRLLLAEHERSVGEVVLKESRRVLTERFGVPDEIGRLRFVQNLGMPTCDVSVRGRANIGTHPFLQASIVESVE